MDVGRLRASFRRIAAYGDQFPGFFYAHLFLAHPQTRDMFPATMETQREHLVGALARIVADADRADDLMAYLRYLGVTHRRFGVATDAGHYEAVGASLLAALQYFEGHDWTAELAADWAEAYGIIAEAMKGAAQENEVTAPAWWDGVITGAEIRSYDVTVLRVQPSPRLEYVPGQSVPVEMAQRPRLWRWYSIANAPRDDGQIELHVRLVDGGPVSMALAGARPGSPLRIGPPAGALVLSEPGRPALMAAQSTGLAPLKAIIEQISELADPPRVSLFLGARFGEDLYDLPAVQKIAAVSPWLTVTPVITNVKAGARGGLADVITRAGPWREHAAYVAGPSSMITATTAALADAGVPATRVRSEDFGWNEP